MHFEFRATQHSTAGPVLLWRILADIKSKSACDGSAAPQKSSKFPQHLRMV